MTEIAERSLIMVVGTDAHCQSVVTQVASHLGAALPKTQRAPSSRHPGTGFGESHPISAINDRLLQRMSGFRNDWRAVQDDLPVGEDQADWREEMRQILAAEYGNRNLVVLNDPHLCPIMRLYLEAATVMQFSPRVIMPFRDPFEAAALLKRSYGFSQEQGLLLWLRRVLQAEHASRHFPRAFISRDQLLANWRKTIKSAARSAEIVWPRALPVAALEINRVLSSARRHDGKGVSKHATHVQASRAESWAEEARSALFALQEKAHDAEACSALDRICEELVVARVKIDEVAAPDCETLLFGQEATGQSVRNEPVKSRLNGFFWRGSRFAPAVPSPFAGDRMQKNDEPVQVDFPIAVHRAPDAPPAGRDICLLVGYAPDGKPTPALISLVDHLAAENVDCHVCLAVKNPALPVDISGLDAAAAIFARANGGYDFAAWASLLESYPSLWTASRLFFANDSIIPVRGFAEMMARLRESQADFIALTESYEMKHHTQSYFFAFQNDALRSDAIRSFWSKVKVETDKLEVVRNYEITLLDRVRSNAGLRDEILFSYEKLFPGASIDLLSKCNPTHHLWERLILADFPFVKAELLHRNPASVWIEHWEDLLESLGCNTDLIRAHLTEMDRTRPIRKKRFAIFKKQVYRLAKSLIGHEGLQSLRERNHTRLRQRRERRMKSREGLPQSL